MGRGTVTNAHTFMAPTIEEQLLRHQIETADGPITVDAGKLRLFLFEKEDGENLAYQTGYAEGFEAGLLQGSAQVRDDVVDFLRSL